MSNEYRMKAIKAIAAENAGGNMPAAPASLDFYGEDVFNADAMRAYLPKDICKKLFATIDEGAPLDGCRLILGIDIPQIHQIRVHGIIHVVDAELPQSFRAAVLPAPVGADAEPVAGRKPVIVALRNVG